MRKTILAAITAFIIGGATTGAFFAVAQPAPPPPGPPGGPPPMHGPMGWMHGPGAWMHRGPGHRPFNPGTFALIYRAPDRNLSAADVQKIAEAFLLWHGNHTWKVTNVVPTSDGAIGFSLATQDGSVVAKFTMNPHTGHVTRVG